jgi:glycosyltransferase involved in cell wall biosynthesis
VVIEEVSRAVPKPRTAVVIRCHQQGRFLREAVESVNTQSCRPDSIVIVNDGSTDETIDVLDSLGDNVVTILAVTRHPALGAVASLNAGIAAAGPNDLICALDADDRLSPRFLELTTAALLHDEDADLAYGAVHSFGDDSAVRLAKPFDLDALMVENITPITAVFRRTMYDRLGPFDQRFEEVGFEDWEYWVRAAVAGCRGIAVEGCWLEYRRHDSGSRNIVGLRRSLRARRQVWWKHRRSLRPRHVGRWLLVVLRHEY